MKKQIRLSIGSTIIMVLSITVAGAQIAANPPFTLEQSVVASGGGVSNDDSNNIYKIEGTIGQFAAGTIGANSPFTLRNGFFTPGVFAPSAATVSIEGRVRTENGAGIRNVVITLTESNGTIRTTASSIFGNFRFTDITVGQVVVLNISAKKFSFKQPATVLTLTEELLGLDFVALAR